VKYPPSKLQEGIWWKSYPPVTAFTVKLSIFGVVPGEVTTRE
jgi:hypothetical protein